MKKNIFNITTMLILTGISGCVSSPKELTMEEKIARAENSPISPILVTFEKLCINNLSSFNGWKEATLTSQMSPIQAEEHSSFFSKKKWNTYKAYSADKIISTQNTEKNFCSVSYVIKRFDDEAIFKYRAFDAEYQLGILLKKRFGSASVKQDIKTYNGTQRTVSMGTSSMTQTIYDYSPTYQVSTESGVYKFEPIYDKDGFTLVVYPKK